MRRRLQHETAGAGECFPANPYCGTRTRLPAEDYVIKEKYLRRYRRLAEFLSEAGQPHIAGLDALMNVGPDSDEIWIEKGLSEAEKRFVAIHELVHARRQLSGEDFEDYQVEEPIVELEAIARTPTAVLGQLSNGLALTLLHDFLTDFGQFNPNTAEGLAAIQRRISVLLGGRPTTACAPASKSHE
ncbi:MAG: hypothetical protein HY660_09040 [Armatimonadetes bacterium]|nr:hypothetical protein [Armatimonadota bacterium]